eukprot:gene4252-3074_t
MPAGELNEKELSEFREIFDLVDSDGSGRITQQELRKLMDTLHLRPTEEELDEMFSEANDREAGIDFDQFVSVMSKRVQSDYTPEQLRMAFKIFETEDLPVGYVSTEVLEHALVTYGSEKLSKEEAARLLAAVDPEGTGRINYHDFVALVSGK